MKHLSSFYFDFYGFRFVRHFRRPENFVNKKFRTQFIVKTPKELYLHVHKNNGIHPCYTHLYDHGRVDNLNGRDKESVLYDRVFFDFDVEDEKVKKIKNNLKILRSDGLNNEKKKQSELRKELQDIIINERAAEPAIYEAKQFSQQFKETFGNELLLFFSGCKGCHAYTFFNSSDFNNLDWTLSWFAEKMKINYPTLDLAVTKDATHRLSRIPYSKHQYTGLTVVPFNVADNYENIMDKSLNPVVESFNIGHFTSNFNIHLQKIDKRLRDNRKVQKFIKRNKVKCFPEISIKNQITDHREFFKKILGEPVREYPEKAYVMYNCPFPDHEDHNPSFKVYKKGYFCYGCQRKGNYWQFLKDYNQWADKDVKKYLRGMKISQHNLNLKQTL